VTHWRSQEEGGYLIFEGAPEELVKCKESYTGKYLKKYLADMRL
jgi:excinuclease ABC subunit A